MKLRWQIFWHTLFWVALTTLILFVAKSSAKLTTLELFVITLFFAIDISLFYVHYLWLIPRFLNKKRYRVYVFSLVIALVGYALVKYGFAVIFKPQVLMRPKMPEVTFGQYMLSTTFTNIVFLFLSAVLKFTGDWFLNERIQRDLENQRLSAELAFLKSQINPHFLFNSLNSIYSLAYQRSETTPEAILKLAEIMRYMLYDCNDNKVDLVKELQYLQNYIDCRK